MRRFLLLIVCLIAGGFIYGQTITPSGPTGFCTGGIVTLTFTGGPGGATYQWQKDGSDIPGATSSNYIANATGAYTIIVTVGGTPATYGPITVNASSQVNPSFISSPAGQCGTVPVTFTNTTAGSGLTYLWNFGDPNSGTSNSSIATDPAHAFIGTPGNSTQGFTVSLTADNAGCKSTTTNPVSILQRPGTQLNGTGKTTYNNKPYFVQCVTSAAPFTFTNASSTTLSNQSYKIVWGDNTPDFAGTTFTSINHTYNIGTYTLQFIVNGTNCSDTGIYYVFIGGNPTGSISSPGSTTGCAGSTFDFPFANISGNPPGTEYYISVDDGSGTSVQYIQANVPAFFPHTFNQSSCDFSPAKTFTVTYLFKNPCGETPGTIGGIRISKKAGAAFTISPKDTVCQNTIVTFTNTGSAGSTMPNTGNICIPGNSIWQISPSTGWTLTGGSFGMDNGSPLNGDAWTSGSTSLGINFTVPGTYIIKLKSGTDKNTTNKCGIDSIIKSICVNPTPTGSFTLDKLTGCASPSLTVNGTAITNTPFCGANKFSWRVSYTPTAGCVPAIKNFSYINGTDSTFAQPVFQFNTPGIYTIGLVIYSPASTCSTTIASQQIVVKGKPNLSFTLPTSVCQNVTVSHTEAATCYMTGPPAPAYLWTITGGTVSSPNTLNPGAIVFNTPGSQTLTLMAINECGSTTLPQNITINPVPDVVVPSNIVTCPGSTVGPLTFTSSLSGVTFSWANSNTAIGLVSSGTGSGINSFTATNSTVNSITAIVTVTATKAGCSITQSFTITVNPKPANPTVSTPVTYCQNEMASPLMATAASGHTLLWYTIVTGGTGSATAPTPSTAFVGAVTYYVSQINTTTGCESGRSAINVTVKPIPSITATFTNPTSCASATGKIVISGLTAGTSYIINYTKNGTPVSALTQTAVAGGTVTLSNLTAGIYDNLTVTLNGCASNIVGPFTLSDPNPPATPTPTVTSPICAGTTLSLGTPAVSGATYTWTGPNGYTSNNQNPTITNATAAATGTYLLTVTVAGCTSAAGNVSAVVNATPIITTAGSNSPACSGNALNLTATTNFADPFAWSWTGPNAYTSNVQNPVINNATTTNAGTYTVTATATSSGCISASKTVTVVVNPTPNIASAAAFDPASCNTSTGRIELSGLTAGSIYTVSYTKNSTPVTVTLTANASGVVIINSLAAGTYDNIKLTLAGCVSNTVGPYTLADPNPPTTPVATSSSPVCSGTTLTLNASTTTAGAVTWVWTGPNGFINPAQNPSINSVALAATGTYSVTATLNGCKSALGTVTVVVNEAPAALGVLSNSPVCTGNAITLSSTTNFTGAVTYAWTGPNGFTSSLPNPSVPNATLAEAGPYKLMITATTGNCPSAISTVNVTVNPTPAITGTSSANPTTCATPTGNITLNGLTPNETYVVSYTNGSTAQSATVTANANGNVIISNLTAGVYSNISLSLAGCLSNVVGPFTLADPNPPAMPVAGSNGPICSGGTISLNASTTTTGNLTWAWTGPNGFVSNVQNPSIVGATVTSSGLYSVRVSQSGCLSAAGTVNVLVNQTPAAPMAGSNGPICAGSTLNLTASTAVGATVTWLWSGPNSFTSNQQNPQINNATASASGTYTVMITSTQGACPSPTASITVTVHPELVNAIDTAAKAICNGQQVIIAGTLPSGGNGTYTYQWEQSPDNINWTSIAGQTGASITLVPTASIYLRRVVSSSPCQSFSLSVYIAVQPPVSNNTIQQDGAICINTSAPTLIGSAPVGANGNYIYQWERSTNGGATWTPIAGATSKDYSPGVLSAITKYRRVVTTSLCNGPQSSTSNTVTITVNPDAKALFLPTDTVKCPPFIITPTVVNLQISPANSQYLWYANGVQIGTGTTFPGYTIANENDSVIIKLKVVSTFGCKDDSLSQKFKTIRKPTPSFTLTDTVGCGPITVSFTNTSTYILSYNYFWDFGNGQTSTAVQPGTILFAPNPAYGDTTYVVKLKVFSPCDTLTFAKSIRVKSKPKALFTPTKTTGCSPMKVTFRNTSKGANNTYFWDFGDGITLATTSPDSVQHTFITGVVDTFYVKLKVTNECGADSLRYAIVVAPNSIRLNLAVNGTDHFGCAPHAVAFFNNSQGASVFRWNFGDGSTTTTSKNVDTVYHTYLTPGTYTATLQAINNCSDTTTSEAITVYPKPRAAFTASRFAICKGDSVRFSNLSDSATAYLWTFGDGGTSTLNNPLHIYTTPGTYVVTLVSYRNNPSGNVCTDSARQSITVTASQTGFFTASDSVSQCAPLTVTFVNKNKPSVTALWDFGDGTTATGDSVVHTFAVFGSYNVKLTATVPGGCTYITTKNILVNGPGGTLQYTGGYKCYPAAVQMQAVATGASTYVWDFGDGSTATTTQQTIFHSYANPGFYLPKVTLQNAAGCNVILKGIDTIKVDKVTGGFTIAKNEVCGATTLVFTDTSKAFFGKQSIKWNFGDGDTGTGLSPSHNYATGGAYTIQLIVIGNSGCTDTITKQIAVLVKAKPIASINADTIGCTRKGINFNSIIQSADAINIIQWNLSNGASGTGAVFNYIFTSPGTFTLRLIAGTVNGCFDTAYHTIVVKPSPFVTATPSLNLCRGSSAQLTVTGATTYQWLPLSGLSCYTCSNPIASPLTTTPYVVEGKNGFGCPDYDTVVITVVQPLKMNVSPPDSICVGGSANLLVSGASSYNWSPAAGLNSTTLSNPTASPTVTTTYRVVGYDGFNCFTDTAFVTVGVGQYPTVNLGPDLILPAGNLHPLTSIITNGPISKWLWSPATNLTCSNCAVPVAEIKKNITYTVIATTPYGCSASDTINIKVTCSQDQVYIPNAFSPDGDGINDVLMVRASGIVTVKYFRVFNRWGELVFEKTDFKANNLLYGWDGKVKGVAAGPDVFVYTCEALCENGSVFTYKGNVTIIK